ncbi:hypothetical protein CR513_26826, partial [Mucuna pruriens]
WIPLHRGGEYYIQPAIPGPSPRGGLTLGRTYENQSPVTVLLSDSVNKGDPVKFKPTGPNPDIIFVGATRLDIEFPMMGVNPKWSLFENRKMQKTYVGIGGPEDHPGQPMLSGIFRIQKYGFLYNSYKLVFCPDYSSTCSDIRTYDNNNEGGKRLVLTQDSPLMIVFENAYKPDATINSIESM